MPEENSRKGYDVTTAEDGEAGFAMYLERNPDVVLTDYVMPRLSGSDMTKKIREYERGRSSRTYIVMMSSNMVYPEEYECLMIDDFVVKGIIGEMLEKIGKGAKND